MAVPAVDFAVGGPARLAPVRSVAQHRRLKSLARHLELWIPGGFLVLMVLACFVWPLVYPVPSPIHNAAVTPNLPPLTHGHILGTDTVGDDVMSRILYGGRVSLEVGFGTTAIGLIVGGAVGAAAAYKGGLVESVVMRVLEVFLSFPALVLAIVVASFLGPSKLHVIWAISFFTIPSFARLARANMLTLREQNFVVAAKISGISDGRMLLRHVAPNILPRLMTFGLLGVGIAMIVEASLSFLGLGVPPPAPSWGNMIAVGQQYLTTSPDLVLIPSAFLFATVLAVNLLGDALRVRWGV